MKRQCKIAALVLALVMSLSLCLVACGESGEVMYVTIAKGDMVISYAEVAVEDEDGDGALTINDALLAAHDKYYDGGADGFGSAQTEYGLSMTKLWGDESGVYGYTLNNTSVMTDLTEPVKAGDHIYAYVYTDLTTWSDSFCYFDKVTAEVSAGETLTLTLSSAGYDEAWNPITVPVEGAKILVDGADSGIVTDAEGKATVTLSDKGEVIISASNDAMVMVPPVCAVTVK
ncbi:MAG: hypothetical protein IJW40_12035 [Clostridia bacterium]|nr:hypothetical protein [Clostridia bacterium]MBQ7339164.1 hypothetical protein [Clostridia bacterium]